MSLLFIVTTIILFDIYDIYIGKSGYEIIKKILQKTNDNIIMIVKNSTKCIELYGSDLLKYKYRYVTICVIECCYTAELCHSLSIQQ